MGGLISCRLRDKTKVLHEHTRYTTFPQTPQTLPLHLSPSTLSSVSILSVTVCRLGLSGIICADIRNSQRGSEQLLDSDGYIYSRKKSKDTALTSTWRCSKYNPPTKYKCHSCYPPPAPLLGEMSPSSYTTGRLAEEFVSSLSLLPGRAGHDRLSSGQVECW